MNEKMEENEVRSTESALNDLANQLGALETEVGALLDKLGPVLLHEVEADHACNPMYDDQHKSTVTSAIDQFSGRVRGVTAQVMDMTRRAAL